MNGDPQDGELRRLAARVATLEQLLEVYERSVLDQADRLYAEQERMLFQTTLLACQGEAVPDGILSVSIDGTVLYANRHLSEMWSIEPPVIGRKSFEEILRSMAERTLDPDAFVRRAGELESGEESREEVALRDGRTFERFTAPIRGDEGRDFGRVWHFRDVTAHKAIGRMKDEFISAVSHELRTPLTSIRGSIDLLAGGVAGALPAEARSLVKVAQGNCGRIVRLINDVLDLEKMEASRMEFHLEPRRLEPLIAEAVEAMRPYGERLGVGFGFSSRCPGAQAQVDADRLLQVMENLLSNAAKFSPMGTTVEVSLAREGDRLRIGVADHGPGIPPDFHDRVFEKFTQAASTGSSQREGTGLGLAIARRIVERIGGEIGFTPRRDGTTFHVDLPEWRVARP